MSLEDIFNEFEEEEEKDKPSPEEAPKPSQEPEGEISPIPEGGDEAEEEVEEEAPVPSEEDESVDWFEEPAKKPVEKEAVEEEPVKEEAAEEAPAKEAPAAEAPAEEIEDWFEPAGEELIPEEAPSEVSTDMAALEGVGVYPIVIPAVTAEAMKNQMKLFQSLKASLLDRRSDIATIQGKPYVKRSGWRKLALAFNISDEILKEEKDVDGDNFTWRIWVRAWAPNGRSAVGIGACSSEERNFAHVQHDVYATAHTRAKNRALSDLIGSGEVSWEELRGFDSV